MHRQTTLFNLVGFPASHWSTAKWVSITRIYFIYISTMAALYRHNFNLWSGHQRSLDLGVFGTNGVVLG
jgi:hypothetical protein